MTHTLWRAGIGALAVSATLVAVPATAQNLTSRFSKVNFNATYGGGEDTFTPNDEIVESDLVSTDTTELAFADTRNGFILNDPARPWGASVSFEAGHQYTVTGSLSGFSRIQAGGATAVAAGASGEGLATIDSATPGNTLEMYFGISALTPVRLSGLVDLNPDGQNLAAYVTLQRFDGIVWANIFNSLFLPGQEGAFDNQYDLIPGDYRIIGLSGGNAFHQVRPSQTNTWSYDLQVVPEPATMLVLGAGLAALAARRRNKKA